MCARACAKSHRKQYSRKYPERVTAYNLQFLIYHRLNVNLYVEGCGHLTDAYAIVLKKRLAWMETWSLSLRVEAYCHMFWQISDVVPFYAMKSCTGSRGIAPHILNLGTRLRRGVIFAPISALPLGKSPRYPLKRRLGSL